MDGVVFVENLKKAYHIEINVRHVQRLTKKLRYSLKQPMYCFIKAWEEGYDAWPEWRGLRSTLVEPS